MGVGAMYLLFYMLYVAGFTGKKYLLRIFVFWQIIPETLHMVDGGPIAPVVFVRVHLMTCGRGSLRR